MDLYGSKLWIDDIDKVLQGLEDLNDLSGKSVLVTGATGLIGSAVIDLLIRYNETHLTPIHIFAAGRSREKADNRFGVYSIRPYFNFVKYNVLKMDSDLPISADYIIHGAGNSYPSAFMEQPVETMQGNIIGTLCLLRHAKEHGSEHFLYISSSEVYGCKTNKEPYKEDEYCYVDLLNPRNSYSMGKRATETLCVSFAEEYGVNVVIVRPGHIYGPTASPVDNRVSSAWAYAAAHGEDIEMKSDGSQLRSYCYCLDCASAIIKVLLRGENRRAYNISNPRSILTIRQMGELLAKAGNVKLVMSETTGEEKLGFNPMACSAIDGTELGKLGWRACFDETGFFHTVDVLKDVDNAAY